MTTKQHTIVAAAVAAAFTIQTAKADLTGSLETKATSNYTYHGQVLDRNPVFVPKLTLQAPVFTGGTLQFSGEQILGTKGSTYYRSQYNAGLALNVGQITVTPGYQLNAFPDRDSKNTQSVTGRLTFNDAGVFPVKLNPTFAVEKAVEAQRGTWYEFSIAPSKNLGKLDLSVPVAVGASSNGYFAVTNKDLRYAYASAGLNATYHVTNRFDLKAGSVFYTTDTRLSNSSNNFVQNQFGLSVSF